MPEYKSGFVAIVGRPNAGKSTLLNRLVGEKIAIISDKPQTTRTKILAIYQDEHSQIIFVDTPGVHKPRTRLGEYMNQTVRQAIGDVDAVLFLVEADRGIMDTERELIQQFEQKKLPVILIINKIDLVQKETLLPLIAEYNALYPFHAIIPISALKADGINAVLSELTDLLPEGPKYYPDDMITDQTERSLVSETVREKMLRLLDKEVPHGTMVEVNQMKTEDSIVRISATIYCEKESHKGIIIGKGGAMLKRIGSYARQDLEKQLNQKVFLELWVKVKDDWRNKSGSLQNFGFGE